MWNKLCPTNPGASWFYALIGIPSLYFLVALVVFDFSAKATPHDEETFQGREVAYGPQPRRFACRRNYYDFFDGEEWPFRVFAPVCVVFRWCGDYEKSGNWR